MKKFILIFTTLLMQVLQISAQKVKPFEGHFVNDEHKVFLHINLYDKNVKIPGQALLGEMSGYIGSHKDSRQWFVLDSQLISANQAQLSIINDYGSEDLEAQLIFTNDSICTLKQITGSPIKFAIKVVFRKMCLRRFHSSLYTSDDDAKLLIFSHWFIFWRGK